MKKILIFICLMILPSAGLCLDNVFDAESEYPAKLDSASTKYFKKKAGSVIQHYDHNVQSDAIIEIQEKLGIGDYTPVADSALVCTTTGTSIWDKITPQMLYWDPSNVMTNNYCLTYISATKSFKLAECGTGGGGGGDNVWINTTDVTGARFINGDIDWTVNTTPDPDEITATVACNGCVDETDLADNSVGTSKVKTDAITNAKMADNSIGKDEMQDDSIGTDELDDSTNTPSAGYAVVVGSGKTFNYANLAAMYQPLNSVLSDLSTPSGVSDFFSFDGGMNVTGGLSLKNGNTSSGYLDIYEKSSDGSSYLRLTVPNIGHSYSLTFPSGSGAPGQFLSTDGAGNLSWAAPSAASADGTSSEVQYRNPLTGNLAGMANMVWDNTDGNPKVITNKSMLFGNDDNYFVGYNSAADLLRFNTADNATGNIDFAFFTFAADTGNSASIPLNQQLFEVGVRGADDNVASYIERFSIDNEGDVSITGGLSVASGATIASGNLTLNTGNISLGSGNISLSSGNINAAGSGSTIKVSGTGSTWSLANSISAQSVGNTAGGTYNLTSTGSATTSGAYIVGAFDDFTNFDCSTVQGCLKSIDTLIGSSGGGYADYIYQGDSRVQVVDTGVNGYIRMYADNHTMVANSGRLRLPDNFDIAWFGGGSSVTIVGTPGNLSLSPGSSSGQVYIPSGNFQLGVGTPDWPLNGDDAYIKGTLEVDGAARFEGTVTAAGITSNASATPSLYFNDSDVPGTQEGAMVVNCATNDNCSMDIGVHSGVDSYSTMIKLDTSSGNTLIKLGNTTDGSNFVQLTESGVLSWEGNSYAADIELGHASDTTLTRSSAGVMAVEGVPVMTTAGGTFTGAVTVNDNLNVSNTITAGTIQTTSVNNPFVMLDDNDATDWYMGIDDSGNALEFRTQYAVGNGVKMELSEDGDLSLSSLVATGTIKGKVDIIPDNDGRSVSTSEILGSMHLATGAGTWTLPDIDSAAGTGQSFCLYSTDANAVAIDPDDEDKIRLGGTLGGAGKKISANAAGAYVCLVLTDFSGNVAHWTTFGTAGTWTLEE